MGFFGVPDGVLDGVPLGIPNDVPDEARVPRFELADSFVWLSCEMFMEAIDCESCIITLPEQLIPVGSSCLYLN